MFRRLLRWGVHVAAALSLVLCITTAIMWVRSHFVCDSLWYVGRGDGPVDVYSLSSETGAVVLHGIEGIQVERRGIGWVCDAAWSWHARPADPWSARCAWFGIGGASFGPPNPAQLDPPSFYVRAPYWSLLVVTAILPAWRVRALGVRRSRRRSGRCLRCGYDLRGNPAARACPECGTPIAPRSTPLA